MTDMVFNAYGIVTIVPIPRTWIALLVQVHHSNLVSSAANTFFQEILRVTNLSLSKTYIERKGDPVLLVTASDFEHNIQQVRNVLVKCDFQENNFFFSFFFEEMQFLCPKNRKSSKYLLPPLGNNQKIADLQRHHSRTAIIGPHGSCPVWLFQAKLSLVLQSIQEYTMSGVHLHHTMYWKKINYLEGYERLKFQTCSLSEEFSLIMSENYPSQILSSTWGKINDVSLKAVSHQSSSVSLHILLVWMHNIFGKFKSEYEFQTDKCFGLDGNKTFAKCSNVSVFELSQLNTSEHKSNYIIFETCSLERREEFRNELCPKVAFLFLAATQCVCRKNIISWLEGFHLCQRARAHLPFLKSRKDFNNLVGFLRLFQMLYIAEGIFIGLNHQVSRTRKLFLFVFYSACVS